MPKYISTLNLKKISRKDLIDDLVKSQITRPLKADLKNLQDLTLKSLLKADYNNSINSLIIALHFDKTKTISTLKKKGAFRYSNYASKKCIIGNILTEILELKGLCYNLSPEDISYFKSVINLNLLHEAYNELTKYIIEEIKSFNKSYKKMSFIKTIVAFSDFLFLIDFSPQNKASDKDPLDISHRTKEDICSATSFLIHFVTDNHGLYFRSNSIVAEQYIISNDINNVIIAACLISDFKECEILIESFDYSCEEIDDKIKIKPPTEEFEKSIRLGFIRTQLQSFNNTVHNVEDRASIEALVEEMLKQDDFKFFRLFEDDGYPRYRVEIPMPVFNFLVDRFFKGDALFQEEFNYLNHTFKEQLLNPKDLQELIIKDDLSLFDVIKIKRVFVLFYFLFSKSLLKEDVSETILFRSIIPIFSEEGLYSFIEKLTSTDKFETYLDIMCWEPGLDVMFDLQYHPILFLNHEFYIPISIFTKSNHIRNLYASEYKRNNKLLLSDGQYDPLVEKLKQSFEKAVIPVFTQTKIINTDIDVFAVIEDVVFVFECKQSLHPVSIFDLRTIKDYITKAEKQIDYVHYLHSKNLLISALETKSKLDLSHITSIVGCIVVNTKLFNGNIFKYPVRNINELHNLVNEGIMKTEEGMFSLWQSDCFQGIDLLDYLSDSKGLFKLFYESLSTYNVNYNVTTPNIEINSYYLSSDVILPNLKKFTSKLKRIE